MTTSERTTLVKKFDKGGSIYKFEQNDGGTASMNRDIFWSSSRLLFLTTSGRTTLVKKLGRGACIYTLFNELKSILDPYWATGVTRHIYRSAYILFLFLRIEFFIRHI